MTSVVNRSKELDDDEQERETTEKKEIGDSNVKNKSPEGKVVA